MNNIKDDTIKEEIERNALKGQYETKENFYANIRKTKIEFSSVREDFYCPLHIRKYDTEGDDIDLEQEDIVRLGDAVCGKLEDE